MCEGVIVTLGFLNNYKKEFIEAGSMDGAAAGKTAGMEETASAKTMEVVKFKCRTSVRSFKISIILKTTE